MPSAGAASTVSAPTLDAFHGLPSRFVPATAITPPMLAGAETSLPSLPVAATRTTSFSIA